MTQARPGLRPARAFTLIELGNNDPAGQEAASDRFVYWGAMVVIISSDPDAWPGAYPLPQEG